VVRADRSERRCAQAIAEEQLDGVLNEQYWREVPHAFRLARVPGGGGGHSTRYSEYSHGRKVRGAFRLTLVG
jgi:hypothetical protein